MPRRIVQSDRPRRAPSLRDRPARSLRKDRPRMDRSLEERPGKDHCERIVRETAATKRVNWNGPTERLRRIVVKGLARTDVLIVFQRYVWTSRSQRCVGCPPPRLVACHANILRLEALGSPGRLKAACVLASPCCEGSLPPRVVASQMVADHVVALQ